MGSDQHLRTDRPRRYESDTTDEEWAQLAQLIPAGGKYGGCRRVNYPRRDIVDAIRYRMATACQWDSLPADFPPWKTVWHYYRAWRWNGLLTAVRASLGTRHVLS